MRRWHVGIRHVKRRLVNRTVTGASPQARSARVRVYRLWTWLERCPHTGQGAERFVVCAAPRQPRPSHHTRSTQMPPTPGNSNAVSIDSLTLSRRTRILELHGIAAPVSALRSAPIAGLSALLHASDHPISEITFSRSA